VGAESGARGRVGVGCGGEGLQFYGYRESSTTAVHPCRKTLKEYAINALGRVHKELVTILGTTIVGGGVGERDRRGGVFWGGLTDMLEGEGANSKN